jgi:hypothetical protein
MHHPAARRVVDARMSRVRPARSALDVVGEQFLATLVEKA